MKFVKVMQFMAQFMALSAFSVSVLEWKYQGKVGRNY